MPDRYAKPSILVLSACFLFVPLLPTPPAFAQAEEEADEPEEWSVSEPPGAWRAVTIDTTETTWSNVDVSPDGSTIVFDMLGDIFTMPIAGGEATALTDGIEWNYQPKYSPTGDEIVFVSDRAGGDNLWIMGADGGSPRAVTAEGEHLVHNPSWSPDGRYLVAKKSFMSTRSIAAGEIWMFHAGDEGGGLQLTERPFGDDDQKNQADPVFSADGKHIFFSQDVTPGPGLAVRQGLDRARSSSSSATTWRPARPSASSPERAAPSGRPRRRTAGTWRSSGAWSTSSRRST